MQTSIKAASLSHFIAPFVVGASITLFFWFLGAYVFFGQSAYISLFGMVIIPFAVNALSFAAKDESFTFVRLWVAIVAVLVLGFGLGLSPAYQMSILVERASNNLDFAAEGMGRAPSVAKKFAVASSSPSVAKKNKAFIREIALSTANREQVVAFLAASAAFGLPADFVRENGIVRDEDRTMLFQEALTMSQDGNAAAMKFLADSAVAKL